MKKHVSHPGQHHQNDEGESVNPHEQEQAQKEGVSRREFVRRGIGAAIGATGMFGLLRGNTAHAQTTNIDDVGSPEGKKAAEQIKKEEPQGAEGGNMGPLTEVAVNQLVDAVNQLVSNKLVFQKLIGEKLIGNKIVNAAMHQTAHDAEAAMGRLAASAEGEHRKTPNANEIQAALKRVQSAGRQRVRSARERAELVKDLSVIGDWLLCLEPFFQVPGTRVGKRTGDLLNPVSGNLGLQISRGYLAYENIMRLLNGEKRSERVHHHEQHDKDHIEDHTAPYATEAEVAIEAATKKEEKKKKGEEKTEAKADRNADKTEQRQDRAEEREEQRRENELKRQHELALKQRELEIAQANNDKSAAMGKQIADLQAQIADLKNPKVKILGPDGRPMDSNPT